MEKKDNCSLNEFLEPMRQEEWSNHLRNMLPKIFKDLGNIVSVGLYDQNNKSVQLISDKDVEQFTPTSWDFYNEFSHSDLSFKYFTSKKYQKAYICKILPKLTANKKISKTAEKIKDTLKLSDDNNELIAEVGQDEDRFKFIRYSNHTETSHCFVMTYTGLFENGDFYSDERSMQQGCIQTLKNKNHIFQIKVIQSFKMPCNSFSNDMTEMHEIEKTFSKMFLEVNAQVTNQQIEDMQCMGLNNDFFLSQMERTIFEIYAKQIKDQMWQRLTYLGFRHNLEDYYLHDTTYNIGYGNFECTFNKLQATPNYSTASHDTMEDYFFLGINFPKQLEMKFSDDININDKRKEVTNQIIKHICSIEDQMRTSNDKFIVVTGYSLSSLLTTYFCEDKKIPLCAEASLLINDKFKTFSKNCENILPDTDLYVNNYLPMTDTTILVIKQTVPFTSGMSLLIDDASKQKQIIKSNKYTNSLNHVMSHWEIINTPGNNNENYYAFKVDIKKLQLLL